MSGGTEVIKQENKFLNLCKYVWKNYSIIVVCVVLFIIFGIIEPRFLQVNNIILILRHSSIVGIIALGMTFVIITGGIDLSSGHVVAFSGAALIFIQGNEAIPLHIAIPLAIVAAIVIATAIGFVNGALTTKFKIPAFITTLAIGIIVRSLTMFFLGGATGRGRIVPEFTQIGLGGIGPIPYSLIIWIVCAIVLGCVLKFTKFGSYIYAVGGNENAAHYSGINVTKIRILAFSLAGLCVGIATVLDMSRMAAISPAMAGEGYEFDAITAAVVGGTSLAGGRGRIVGSVFGMILVTVVTNLMIMTGISPFLSGAVKGGIILAAVLMQRKD
ncbi:MAG: ABC transporter permease [Oscillospiraceae bacterium]|nr:ABC transporter permease [Oscillospiraceae bacterium]